MQYEFTTGTHTRTHKEEETHNAKKKKECNTDEKEKKKTTCFVFVECFKHQLDLMLGRFGHNDPEAPSGRVPRFQSPAGPSIPFSGHLQRELNPPWGQSRELLGSQASTEPPPGWPRAINPNSGGGRVPPAVVGSSSPLSRRMIGHGPWRAAEGDRRPPSTPASNGRPNQRRQGPLRRDVIRCSRFTDDGIMGLVLDCLQTDRNKGGPRPKDIPTTIRCLQVSVEEREREREGGWVGG